MTTNFELLTKDQPVDFLLGARGAGEFILPEEAIQARMAVLGASGSGKSRFLYLLFASLVAAGKGFLLIDPHGDLAHALLGYMKSRNDRGDPRVLRRFHFLEPSQKAFCLDPFAHAPRNVSHESYHRWLKTKVDRVCRNLMRRVSEADQEVMLRLRRWMKNIITACGVSWDSQNSHAGLQEALTFTNPQSRDFALLYTKVSPHLPAEVREDFEKLIQTKKPLDQERWLESSINRFREVLSPLTRALFRPQGNALDMLGIIRSGGQVVVSLQETNEFSHDEKVVIGGLLIDEVLTAKQAEEEMPEEKRIPFVLGIDEFGEFLGEDLLRAFGAVRKYKLSIIVSGQDLSTLKKGELDLQSKVLTQCMTKVVFNMTWPEDLEILSRVMGTGNLDFTELIQEVERHGGYEFIRVVDPSISISTGSSQTKGGSKSESEGGMKSTTHTEGQQQSKATGNTRTDTTVRGEQQSVGTSTNSNRGTGETLDIYEGILRDRFPTSSSSEGVTVSKNSGTNVQNSNGNSQMDSTTEGTSISDASAEGTNWSTGTSENWTEGENKSISVSLAYKLIQLARVVREHQRTGSLERSVSDQFEAIKQLIHGLRPRFCLVKLPDQQRAFLAEVATVNEPFTTPTAKARAIAAMKEILYKLRPYYVTAEQACLPPQLLDAATTGEGAYEN